MLNAGFLCQSCKTAQFWKDKFFVCVSLSRKCCKYKRYFPQTYNKIFMQISKQKDLSPGRQVFGIILRLQAQLPAGRQVLPLLPEQVLLRELLRQEQVLLRQEQEQGQQQALQQVQQQALRRQVLP